MGNFSNFSTSLTIVFGNVSKSGKSKVSKVKIVRQQKFNAHKIALHFSLDLPVSKTIYLSGWNQLNLSFQSNNGEKKFQSTKSSKIITLPIRSKP